MSQNQLRHKNKGTLSFKQNYDTTMNMFLALIGLVVFQPIACLASFEFGRDASATEDALDMEM
jgi:hypothetical protein